MSGARYTRSLPDLGAEAALASAAKRARRFFISTASFRASVIALDADVEAYQRALHQIEHRRMVLHTAPGGGGARRSLPDPDAVDPWQVNPATVASDTRVTTNCTTCGGDGRVNCGRCGGTTWASCPYCIGGKQIARKKGQLFKNCVHCRGRGTQKCTSCHGGQVGCSSCSASGLMTAWLSVEQTYLQQVQVHPRNAAAGVHRRVDSPADFDASSWPNQLTSDTGVQSQLSVPSELAAMIDARAARVTAARIQCFSSTVYRIRFSTALGEGAVDVAGQPPTISSTSSWAGLRGRRRLMALTGLLGLLGASLVMGAYLNQHAWFVKHGNSGAIFALTAIAGFFAAATVGALLLPRIARNAASMGAPAAGMVAFLVGTAIAFNHHRPTADGARAALAARDHARASLEAKALIDLALAPAVGNEVLDEVHFREVQSAATVTQQAALLRQAWYSTEKRTAAIALVQPSAQSLAVQLYGARDANALDHLAADADGLMPPVAQGARWLAATVHAGDLIRAGDVRGADRALADVASLAADAPQEMKPANAARIIEAAAQLKATLGAVSARSARDRRQGLLTSIEATKAFADASGMQTALAIQGLSQQLQKVRTEIVRADRRAKRKADEAVGESAAGQSPPDDKPSDDKLPALVPSPAAATDRHAEPIDPYAK